VTAVMTVIGEALIDLVPDGPSDGEYRARLGGSPFNVAVGLARLGNTTALMARLSGDAFGRMLRDAAAGEGIDLDAAPHAAERSTIAIVTVGEDAVATYDFHLEGTADWQWTDAELARLRPDTQVLHFGSIASWTAPGNARIDDLVRDVRAAGGVLVSYDPNVRPAVIGARHDAVRIIEQCVRCAHVAKASREDLEWLYPGHGAEDAGARWNQLGAALVVVTDGPNGATAYRRHEHPLRRPGRPVDVVDTIGAGDAFTSGLLNGLARRGLHRDGAIGAIADAAMADVLDEAILVASVTCERAGADPPRADELRLSAARA
jgi:fructokinase